MAFSYGFFNAKNLDRTYTAENFCDYLGSIICDGIQDNYGKCFLPAKNKLNLVIGSGKAWIKGHYFISDSLHIIDLSKYADESLPRYVTVGICCNTAENYRSIDFEVITGTPATSPSIPQFENTEEKTYLTLCSVKIDANAEEIFINDYRDNVSYCGYVRCILGKCQVTEMLIRMEDMDKINQSMKNEIEKLKNTVENLQTKVDDLTGDIVMAGSLGESIYYVLYSNGDMVIRGNGEMYNYNLNENIPPLRGNNDIKSVVVSEGVTSVGDYVFENCQNLESISLPQTIKTIGERSFMQGDGYIDIVYGLADITIPPNVTAIGSHAFLGTAIKSISIPSSVTEIGEYVCKACINLETAKIDGSVIGPFMFTGCEKLKSMTISSNLEKFGEHALNYCYLLETIVFKGTLKQWQAVEKGISWDGHGGMDVAQSGLVKIQCFDGYMEYDKENKVWNEVAE